MDSSEENRTSPINYLKIFFRRKELILIPMFIGLILGVCSGILLPKQYRSSTVILVQEGKSDNPLFNNLAVSTTVGQRMSGIKESILGWNSLVELIKRLKLDQNVKTKLEFESLIMGLRKNIIINLRGHNIINLTYVGDQPEETQAVVKNITDIFVNKNISMQNQETSDAIIFIESQLRIYEGKIKSAEIAQREDRLKDLLVDSTEKHPLVRQLRDQIGAQRAELKRKKLEYTENIVLSSQMTNPMIDDIKRALNTLESGGIDQGSLRNSDDSTQLLINVDLEKVLARDVGVNQKIYDTLLQRLETAKITRRLQSSKEGARYTVLDPPRVPLKAFKPDKVLVAFMGMFLGIAFGAGLIFIREFMDKSFIDVEDAKNFFEAPLLGAISKIYTNSDVRRERERQFWMYGMTLVASTAIILVTTVVAGYLK